MPHPSDAPAPIAFPFDDSAPTVEVFAVLTRGPGRRVAVHLGVPCVFASERAAQRVRNLVGGGSTVVRGSARLAAFVPAPFRRKRPAVVESA